MDWSTALALILGGFMLMMLSGVPVAFSFTFINILAAYHFWGEIGFSQVILSIYDSVTKFTLLPVTMFILMGEIIFHSKIGTVMLDVVDKWFGRIPGRLSIVAVFGGTIFSTMSGASVGTAAMLGAVLVPEMEKRGYKKSMSIGPILGSGGLAMMIPPSGLGILLAVIAEISLGRLLIGIIVPGLIMSLFYTIYIVVRCWLQPSIAPPYDAEYISFSQKVLLGVKYVLPLGIIIFLVLGFMFLGIATPSESAAIGAMGTVIIAIAYKKMSWEVMIKSIHGTLRVAGMGLLIVTGSAMYSQILAFSGATRGLVQFVTSFTFPPLIIVIIMLLITGALGCFMEIMSIMMITLPIFMPILNVLGYDPVWFGAIMLLVFEMSQTTPPFGMILYVMKTIAPEGTTIEDCIKAALPFLGLDLIVVILMLLIPQIVLWLPSAMR